ncbi:MAG: hypothetical protein ACPIDR_00920 [Candidatus Puniceispirillaceae bacterium]
MGASDETEKPADELASDQLKDQFVAWFIVVMAGYYLLDYMREKHKN